MKWKAEIEISPDDLDPDIHPEDARNAILAWFRRSSKDRRKPPHIILEKSLIASAMNAKDGKQILAPVWKDAAGSVIAVPSDDFDTRWKRARKDGRKPIWDSIDYFMLTNWRVIRWPEAAGKGCPGLREWSPRAAVALLRTLPEDQAGRVGDEKWYNQKRLRLGLNGRLRYLVRDFRRFQDGHCEIDNDE
jgi:hypothetical protein